LLERCRRMGRTVHVLVAFLAALNACVDGLPICTVGEVRVCDCTADIHGTQQCVAQGSAWDTCTCGDTSRFTCGDGRCGPNEGRRNCSVDCPVLCGDGRCDLEENTASCPEDCPSCMPCAAADCPAGMRCGQRNCDGSWGCFVPDAGTVCASIDGVACPRVRSYWRCTPGTDDCGPYADCLTPPGAHIPFCSRRCARSPECGAPYGYTAREVCDTALGHCVLRCAAQDTCPPGLACEIRASGEAGRCL